MFKKQNLFRGSVSEFTQVYVLKIDVDDDVVEIKMSGADLGSLLEAPPRSR